MNAITQDFTISPALVMAMLDEIGRHRALADHETDIIEDIVMLGVVTFRWNSRMDAALVMASHSPGAIARFARRHGISGGAAYQRLARIRRRKARAVPGKRRKG